MLVLKNHLSKSKDEIHEFDFRNLEICSWAGDWENEKTKGQEKCLILKTSIKFFHLQAKSQIDRDIWIKAFNFIIFFFQ